MTDEAKLKEQYLADAVENAKQYNILLPTFRMLDDPSLIPEKVKEELRKLKGQTGITFCGGEPMLQCKALLEITRFCKQELGWNVWSFTGLVYERIPRDGIEWEFVKELDALIDGPFIMSQRDLTMKFRGSRNQRILHLKDGEITSIE